MRLDSIAEAGLRNLASYANLTRAVIAINAGSAATVKTTNAIVYISNGVFKNKTALSAQAFSSGHAVVAALKNCFFVWSLDASGNVKTYQGEQFTTNADGKYVVGSKVYDFNSALVPDVGAGYTPFAIVKITTAAATTFTPGTTALDAAGVTVAYYDVMYLPVDINL